ncbi:Ric8 multi-domain protein [Pyrenophora tritici-repentis]|uniref:Ric8 multi-domain protein n=1 Tax=Pyrenophora tritici-repentis TaxID=45151 RepID=A0A834VV48_9PLEO|nr:Ric8 multi-domain protein [Pyrenophora tritici-repentis]
MLMSQKSGRAKLDDVTRLLSELKADLDAKQLSIEQRRKLLEQLKVYGRLVDNSDPIFTEDGLRTLGRCAFDGETTPASQEALRCIANALLLQPKTRQILVDLGHGPHAAEKLKSDSIDDEFLAARVLFLMTYDANLDYAQLVRQNQLADSINAAIARHAARYSKTSRQPSQEHTQRMELMALSETLKLVFNIIHFHKDLSPHFTPSIPNVFRMLKTPKAKKQSSPPSIQTSTSRASSPCLTKQSSYTPPKELDDTITPVITLLRRIYEIASDPVKQTMQTLLLPTPAERDKPLGKSDTLSSRLLNLSTSALTPTLRGSIASMLFELSQKDPATFVHNVGYGFASGYLLSNNIPMPDEVVKANAGKGIDEAIPVNPITGQRLDKEEVVQTEPMSQEEKEREAERLFVLFERLKATGVMDVQNPVEEAYRSGRIQELDDDDDSE